MSNTPDGTILLTDLAKRKSVTGKFGNMRKPQEFTVYPAHENDTKLIVQSDKSIGVFDTRTGEGRWNCRGKYFMHLGINAGAEPFTFPREFVLECLKVAGIVTVMPKGTEEVVKEEG